MEGGAVAGAAPSRASRWPPSSSETRDRRRGRGKKPIASPGIRWLTGRDERRGSRRRGTGPGRVDESGGRDLTHTHAHTPTRRRIVLSQHGSMLDEQQPKGETRSDHVKREHHGGTSRRSRLPSRRCPSRPASGASPNHLAAHPFRARVTWMAPHWSRRPGPPARPGHASAGSAAR
nr:hypothetical protein CFP56_58193 [Quercus suber]